MGECDVSSKQVELRRLPGTPGPDRNWRAPRGNIIAGDCAGDPLRQAVILMHGGGQTRHAWKGACESLAAAGYFALALDARGRGDSSWTTDDGYRFADMGDDLAFVIYELGLKKPILVGASIGGIVAMYAQCCAKVDASALILVDIALTLSEQGVDRIFDFMHQGRKGFECIEDVADAIASYQPERKTLRPLEGLTKNVRVGDNGRYYWHWDPALLLKLRHEIENVTIELRDSAETIDVPVLLIKGARSDVLTGDGVKDFKALCLQMEYINVAGASHMVAGDQNDIFITAILSFIERKVRP